MEQPKENVRITDYRVMPWPDGTRVTLEMGLTPFRTLPALDMLIVSEAGEVLRHTSYLGALERRPAPTLHLPKLPPGTKLLAVMQMLDGDAITQEVIVPFQVAGAIVKQMTDLGKSP